MKEDQRYPAAYGPALDVHTNLLCYRRVIQSRTNSPADAGRSSHFNGLGACWLGQEGESKSGATAFDFDDYSELS
jgi:hypothetical protein